MFSSSQYKNFFLLLAGLFIYFSLSAFTQGKEEHPDVDYSVSCMECHMDETPQEVKDWQSSAHGTMTFGCYMCHGDGVEEFAAKPNSETCESCHDEQYTDLTSDDEMQCFNCHQGHTLKFHK